MVPETKQDGGKTCAGTLNERGEDRKKEGRKKQREREIDGSSETGKSHGTPSRSGREAARLWGEKEWASVIPELLFPKHRSP